MKKEMGFDSSNFAESIATILPQNPSRNSSFFAEKNMFESLQVHQVNPGDFRKKVAGVFLFLSFQAPVGETQQELFTPETSILVFLIICITIDFTPIPA